MIFFTSDLHFGHDNIIMYCNRPYANSQVMDEALIQNWNSVVSKEDTVYVLGDMFMGDKHSWAGILARLNGKIILIRGNHDKPNKWIKSAGFAEIHEDLVIELDGIRLWLNHYPLEQRQKRHPKTFDYALCGHSHSKPDNIFREKCMDVGVDGHNYLPWRWPDIKALISSHF